MAANGSCYFDLWVTKNTEAVQNNRRQVFTSGACDEWKRARPSTVVASIAHGEHEDKLVALKKRTEERRRQSRDELKIEEADVPTVPAKVYTPSPKDTTDTVRPTCLTGAGARSASLPSLPFSLPHKHNASGRANKHVPKIAMDVNEMTDDTNGPKLVIHDSSSDGVWAVFTKMEGDRAHVKNKVANIIRSLGCSIIKSDQALVIKSMERKDVESLHEDDFGEFCCCQVVMLHSPVGESAANGVIENAIQRVQGQVRAIKLDIETNIKAKLNPSQTIWLWPIEYAAQTFLFWRTSGDDGLTAIQRIRGRSTMAPRPRFGERTMYKILKVVKLSKSEAKWRCGVWIGSIKSIRRTPSWYSAGCCQGTGCNCTTRWTEG